MKRILSLLVTTAAFALCSCQSTVKSDIKAESGAACCASGAKAKTTGCASCDAAGAKHKH
jgi:hypothetical protein